MIFFLSQLLLFDSFGCSCCCYRCPFLLFSPSEWLLVGFLLHFLIYDYFISLSHRTLCEELWAHTIFFFILKRSSFVTNTQNIGAFIVLLYNDIYAFEHQPVCWMSQDNDETKQITTNSNEIFQRNKNARHSHTRNFDSFFNPGWNTRYPQSIQLIRGIKKTLQKQ